MDIVNTINEIQETAKKINIINENKKISYSKSWDENIKLDYYEDTKDKKPYHVNHLFNLPIGGEYSINIIVNDFVNHLSFRGEKEFIVNEDHYLSDILLFYKRNNEFLNKQKAPFLL